MKKLLSILLVLSLVYGLYGCAGGEAAGQTVPNESAVLSVETVSDNVDTAEGENKDISYDFTVSVTMPAAFTVYLDNEMHIAAMEAVDADAEAILSGLELAGMTYDEGMGLVLNAAYAQGVLADQGKVYFTVTCDAISVSLMENLVAPVIQFEKENSVFIFIDWDVIPIEEPDYEANYLYGLQKIKKDGQTIYLGKTARAHPYYGPQTVYTYYSEPPVYIDPELVQIKVLCFNEDGTCIVQYYENGRIIKFVKLFGGNLEVLDYENGGIAAKIIKDEDGHYFFDKWAGSNEDGYVILAKSFGCWEDGTQYIQTFHSNGNVATEERFGSYRSSSQATYDENGNELHRHDINRYADGTYSEYEYENGQSIYSKEVGPDGSWTECKYENDYPIYQKTVNPDGTYLEGRFENGSWTYTEGVIEPTAPES